MYFSLIQVYMCVKLLPGDLNSSHFPPHPTSIYICEVTIAPRMYGGKLLNN